MTSYRVTGLVFLLFGCITLFAPQIFETYYHIGLTNPAARAMFVSLVGGTEIALGIALIGVRWFGFEIATLLGICALILVCIAVSRTFTMIYLDAISWVGFAEVSVEGVGAVWLRKKARKYSHVVKT